MTQQPFTVNHTGEFIRLTSRNFTYHPSVMNAIDRVAGTHVRILCFDEFLDKKDYTLLTEHMGIMPLVEGHSRHTTIVGSGRFPISMISHAVSMTAIIDTHETRAAIMETSTRKCFFVLCDKTSEPGCVKPYKNEDSVPVRIRSHDFIPYVYTRSTVQDRWKYDMTESHAIDVTKIFAYNEEQTTVEHGKSLLVVVKPTLFKGFDHPRGIPCIRRYQWIVSPKLIEQGFPVVSKDYSLIHKIEGKPSAKERFLASHVENGVAIPQNKFGKPYGVDLMFIYNGKMKCHQVVREAVGILQEALELFAEQLDEQRGSLVIGKLDLSDRNEQVITMPKTSDLNLRTHEDGKYSLLIDDSLLHMLSVKIMEIVDVVIDDQLATWKEVSIFYKVPHRLIPSAELHVSIPDNNNIVFTKNLAKLLSLEPSVKGSKLVDALIKYAVASCRTDLDDILFHIPMSV
jgi:hypothetical protein